MSKFLDPKNIKNKSDIGLPKVENLNPTELKELTLSKLNEYRLLWDYQLQSLGNNWQGVLEISNGYYEILVYLADSTDDPDTVTIALVKIFNYRIVEIVNLQKGSDPTNARVAITQTNKFCVRQLSVSPFNVKLIVFEGISYTFVNYIVTPDPTISYNIKATRLFSVNGVERMVFAQTYTQLCNRLTCPRIDTPIGNITTANITNLSSPMTPVAHFVVKRHATLANYDLHYSKILSGYEAFWYRIIQTSTPQALDTIALTNILGLRVRKISTGVFLDKFTVNYINDMGNAGTISSVPILYNSTTALPNAIEMLNFVLSNNDIAAPYRDWTKVLFTAKPANARLIDIKVYE